MMSSFLQNELHPIHIAQMAVCLFSFPSRSVIYYRNTDKMSDEEKIPIALIGLAGISLPFIFGLIALYDAQG
jgi:hypothetical protein